MNCTICNKPVTLSPSAAERAAKWGQAPAYYTNLFTTHADCEIAQRHRPVKWTPIAEQPAIFREESMLMLRQRVMKLYVADIGSQAAADYVNNMDEAALLASL